MTVDVNKLERLYQDAAEMADRDFPRENAVEPKLDQWTHPNGRFWQRGTTSVDEKIAKGEITKALQDAVQMENGQEWLEKFFDVLSQQDDLHSNSNEIAFLKQIIAEVGRAEGMASYPGKEKVEAAVKIQALQRGRMARRQAAQAQVVESSALAADARSIANRRRIIPAPLNPSFLGEDRQFDSEFRRPVTARSMSPAGSPASAGAGSPFASPMSSASSPASSPLSPFSPAIARPGSPLAHMAESQTFYSPKTPVDAVQVQDQAAAEGALIPSTHKSLGDQSAQLEFVSRLVPSASGSLTNLVDQLYRQDARFLPVERTHGAVNPELVRLNSLRDRVLAEIERTGARTPDELIVALKDSARVQPLALTVPVERAAVQAIAPAAATAQAEVTPVSPAATAPSFEPQSPFDTKYEQLPAGGAVRVADLSPDTAVSHLRARETLASVSAKPARSRYPAALDAARTPQDFQRVLDEYVLTGMTAPSARQGVARRIVQEIQDRGRADYGVVPDTVFRDVIAEIAPEARVFTGVPTEAQVDRLMPKLYAAIDKAAEWQDEEPVQVADGRDDARRSAAAEGSDMPAARAPRAAAPAEASTPARSASALTAAEVTVKYQSGSGFKFAATDINLGVLVFGGNEVGDYAEDFLTKVIHEAVSAKRTQLRTKVGDIVGNERPVSGTDGRKLSVGMLNHADVQNAKTEIHAVLTKVIDDAKKDGRLVPVQESDRAGLVTGDAQFEYKIDLDKRPQQHSDPLVIEVPIVKSEGRTEVDPKKYDKLIYHRDGSFEFSPAELAAGEKHSLGEVRLNGRVLISAQDVGVRVLQGVARAPHGPQISSARSEPHVVVTPGYLSAPLSGRRMRHGGVGFRSR